MPQVSPQQIFAISYNSTSLNVSWSPIDQSREMLRGKLIGYRVSLFYNINLRIIFTYVQNIILNFYFIMGSNQNQF